MICHTYHLTRKKKRPVLVSERVVDYPAELGRFTSPQEIYDIINNLFMASDDPEEHIYMICVNGRLAPIGFFDVAHGSMTQCQVGVQQIFTRAALCGAYAIIIAHNHPSGDTTPSEPDMTFTERIKEAGKIMDIPLVDHLIIGENGYYSFHEEGKLGKEGAKE